MPKVGKKHYPYTKAGMKAAKARAKAVKARAPKNPQKPRRGRKAY
tara:strand:+ start:68 stop:202 length:135 start_codon:yes stop_codon:yes gene_type:complete